MSLQGDKDRTLSGAVAIIGVIVVVIVVLLVLVVGFGLAPGFLG